MTRSLIFPVCLGLLLVSVAYAARFQPGGARQNFIRRINLGGRPNGGGGGGTSSNTRQRVIRGQNLVLRPYNGPGIPSSQQVENFFQRNPAARQRAQAVESRSFSFSQRHFNPGCGCTQFTCVAGTVTGRTFVDQMTGQICIITAPAAGLTETLCTVGSIGQACTEVGSCGMGTCMDVGFTNVPFSAVCITSTDPTNIQIRDVQDTASLANGCCCQ